MLYAIISEDVPDSLPLRKQARPAHLARLEGEVERLEEKVDGLLLSGSDSDTEDSDDEEDDDDALDEAEADLERTNAQVGLLSAVVWIGWDLMVVVVGCR